MSAVACEATNRRGEATVDLDATAGTDYPIRVAPLGNSVADAFALRVVVPDEPAQPPGQALAANGVNAAVDRFADPDDAWAVRLREGRTYRLNFVTSGSGCAQAQLFPAGTGDFDSSAALRTMRCDAHTVFTPPASGRYTVLVRAPRASRARLPYRLRVGRAGRDDTAPGRSIADDRRVKGSLHGSELDAVDLYRFSLQRRSDLRIRLRTGADLQVLLLTDGGHRIAGGESQIERRMRPGRYFLAVRARDGANGAYVLSRLARTITHARTRADRAAVGPGGGVTLSLRVTPPVDGRATLLVERFDPLAGWLFDVRYHPAVRNGIASVGFRPPTACRWRVTGGFDGTRHSSPSAGGTAHFRVTDPAQE